jgi:hypothetical protein
MWAALPLAASRGSSISALAMQITPALNLMEIMYEPCAAASELGAWMIWLFAPSENGYGPV